jgi:hypothetical protein
MVLPTLASVAKGHSALVDNIESVEFEVPGRSGEGAATRGGSFRGRMDLIDQSGSPIWMPFDVRGTTVVTVQLNTLAADSRGGSES